MGKFINMVMGFLAIVGISLGGIIAFQELRTKQLSGSVHDCATGLPIGGVAIKLMQKTALTGDTVYAFHATSTSQGLFSLSFNKGHRAQIHASKEGYLTAQELSKTEETPKIGLVPQNTNDSSTELTSSCKRFSDCMVKEEINVNGKKIVMTKNECKNEEKTEEIWTPF